MRQKLNVSMGLMYPYPSYFMQFDSLVQPRGRAPPKAHNVNLKGHEMIHCKFSKRYISIQLPCLSFKGLYMYL